MGIGTVIAQALGGTSGSPAVNIVSASGAAQTLTAGAGVDTAYDITLTASCALSLAGGQVGKLQTITVVLRQDATAGRSPTLPGGVSWPGGAAPVLNNQAGRIDILQFATLDGGSTWFGSAVALGAAVPTPAAAPAITLLPGSGLLTVALSGAAPAANGSPITGYNLYVNGTIAAVNVALPYDLLGLTNGTQYTVAVAAVNGVEGARTTATGTPNVTAWTPAARRVVADLYVDPLISSSVTLGTSPAIAAVKDQSASAYSLAQPNTAQQPVLIPAGSSNLGTGPAIRSSGSTKLLKITAATPGSLSPAPGTGSSLINTGNLTEMLENASGSYSVAFGTNTITQAGFPADGTPFLFGAVWSLTSISFYANGKLIGTQATTAPALAGSLYCLLNSSGGSGRVFSWNEAGVCFLNRNAGDRPLVGDVGTLLYAHGADSDSDRHFMEGYVLWAYGLQASLIGEDGTSAHVWRNASPTR